MMCSVQITLNLFKGNVGFFLNWSSGIVGSIIKARVAKKDLRQNWATHSDGTLASSLVKTDTFSYIFKCKFCLNDDKFSQV